MEYCYFGNSSLNFKITPETQEKTCYTFHGNGRMWEERSLYEFYKDIIRDPTEKVTIVDIGAQSGLYTLFAKFLPNATFYAFEPFPETYKLLNDNIELNGIKNVHTFNFAISDAVGESELCVCKNHNGLHTLGQNMRFGDDNMYKLKVPTHTLDELFFNTNTPINYIKIDTEGWEYFILKGGIETIKKYKPLIQIEWNETNMKQCNVTPGQLYELFSELNYTVKNKVDEEVFLAPL